MNQIPCPKAVKRPVPKSGGQRVGQVENDAITCVKILEHVLDVSEPLAGRARGNLLRQLQTLRITQDSSAGVTPKILHSSSSSSSSSSSRQFDSSVLPNPSRRDVLELANLVLGPWIVANSRASAGDHSARMRTRRKNGVRNDAQSCGLSSPKRKRGKPNGWACLVFGETSASDITPSPMQHQLL